MTTQHAETCNAYGLPRQRLAFCTCGAQPDKPPHPCECAACIASREDARADERRLITDRIKAIPPYNGAIWKSAALTAVKP